MAYETYKVRGGDSLSKIANQLGLDGWRDLYNLNRSTIGGNYNLIRPGQVLNIPGTQTTVPTTNTSTNLAKDYTSQGVDQINRAADIPLFSNAVGTLKQLWNNRFLEPVSAAAEQQIRPEYTRQYDTNAYDYLNSLYNTGGQRMGTGPGGGIGSVKAASNRAYLNTLNSWIDQQKQAFNQGWYEPVGEAWNEARTRPDVFKNAEEYKIPTLQEVGDKYLSAYNPNSASLF